jgi:hypothetical protein
MQGLEAKQSKTSWPHKASWETKASWQSKKRQSLVVNLSSARQGNASLRDKARQCMGRKAKPRSKARPRGKARPCGKASHGKARKEPVARQVEASWQGKARGNVRQSKAWEGKPRGKARQSKARQASWQSKVRPRCTGRQGKASWQVRAWSQNKGRPRDKANQGKAKPRVKARQSFVAKASWQDNTGQSLLAKQGKAS